MAKGTVNKVIVMGTIGKTPEVRYMPSGIAAVNISIATNDGYKDKQTNQYIDVTEWHRVVAFGKQAEVIGQYCEKGNKIYIEGRISTNKWQDKNGQERQTTEIVANEIQLLGGKNSSSSEVKTDIIQAYRPSGKVITNNYERAKQGREIVQQTTVEQLNDFNDDEIPF